MKKHWIALSILVAVVAVVAIAAYNYTVANRLADNGAIAPGAPFRLLASQSFVIRDAQGLAQ